MAAGVVLQQQRAVAGAQPLAAALEAQRAALQPRLAMHLHAVSALAVVKHQLQLPIDCCGGCRHHQHHRHKPHFSKPRRTKKKMSAEALAAEPVSAAAAAVDAAGTGWNGVWTAPRLAGGSGTATVAGAGGQAWDFRLSVAVVGAATSGKSTLFRRLAAELSQASDARDTPAGSAAYLGLDYAGRRALLKLVDYAPQRLQRFRCEGREAWNPLAAAQAQAFVLVARLGPPLPQLLHDVAHWLSLIHQHAPRPPPEQQTPAPAHGPAPPAASPVLLVLSHRDVAGEAAASEARAALLEWARSHVALAAHVAATVTVGLGDAQGSLCQPLQQTVAAALPLSSYRIVRRGMLTKQGASSRLLPAANCTQRGGGKECRVRQRGKRRVAGWRRRTAGYVIATPSQPPAFGAAVCLPSTFPLCLSSRRYLSFTHTGARMLISRFSLSLFLSFMGQRPKQNKGAFIKSWKLRRFVLEDSGLLTYSADGEDQARGTIDAAKALRLLLAIGESCHCPTFLPMMDMLSVDPTWIWLFSLHGFQTAECTGRPKPMPTPALAWSCPTAPTILWRPMRPWLVNGSRIWRALPNRRTLWSRSIPWRQPASEAAGAAVAAADC